MEWRTDGGACVRVKSQLGNNRVSDPCGNMALFDWDYKRSQ